MEIVSKNDAVGENGDVRIQFKARTDDIFYLFWEDHYVLCEGEEKFERMLELEKAINNMFTKVAMNQNLKGGYKGSSVYNRNRFYNRRVNDFRTGRNIISCSILEDCYYKLSTLGRVLNTTASNIFRLCVFDTINLGNYQDRETVDILTGILIEYKTIMVQINDMLRDLNMMDNRDDADIKMPEQVNDSTYRT